MTTTILARRATTEAPLVSGLPILGSAFDILANVYGFWTAQHRRHGPVYRVRLPIEGGEWVVAAGRDANAFLAREGHRVFSSVTAYPRAPKILGTAYHPSWTDGDLQVHLKKQIAPGFSRHAVAPHLPAMARFVRDYVRGWLPGQPLDVVSETARLGLNCVAIFATGREFGHETDGLARYSTVFTGVLAQGWPSALLEVGPLNATRVDLDKWIEERLAEHRASPPRGNRAPDYFDLVLQGKMPDGSPLDERTQVVFGQIPIKNMGVYAGRVINHVLYHIVSRPEVLAAVEPEVDAVFAGEPTPTALLSLQALRATMKETLRIQPVATAVQRRVCAPFEFAGYRFEVGDRVLFPIAAPHFLSEHFPEPDRFDITRFLGGRREDQQPFAYVPFGLGNHACVAPGFFDMITTLIIGTIVRSFRLSAPYQLRTIVDALPGPWPWHEMKVVARRAEPAVTGPRAAPRLPEVDEIEALFDAVDRAEILRLRDGEQLFAQGDVADRLYLQQSGNLRILRREVGETEPREIAVRGAGSVIGEIGILHGVPRTATVVASGPVTLLCITADAFRRAVAECDITAEELALVALRRHAGSLLKSVLACDVQPDLGRVHGLSTRTLAPGEVAVREGDAADCFYVVADGEVDVSVSRAAGDPVRVATLRAPACFGEMGVLDGCPRTATVSAGTAGALLLRFDEEAFAQILDDGAVGAGLTALAAERRDALAAAKGAPPP